MKAKKLHRPPFEAMEAHRIQLKVSLVLWLISSVLAQPLSSHSERSALFGLRSTLGLRARDWPRKADPCSWRGVSCRNGRVVGINVSGLTRTHLGRRNPQFAVDSLANFTLLASFNSSGFLLPGSIPDWFGRSLSALQVLDLRSCSITGPIPSSLGNLSGLNYLYLSDNLLTGAIPSTLGQLSSLYVLDLSRNSLTGAIPSTLRQFSLLPVLNLSQNTTTEAIPSTLGQLSSLSVLNLSRNSLTGAIPDSFSALHNLSRLDLSSNFLSGSIPSGLGSLSGLQFLCLQNNSLIASIPVQLGALSQLIELDLGKNGLSGSLPNGLFSNLTQLQYVVLSWNSFGGNLPDILWSMPHLYLLDVSGNNFTGVLPNLTSLANATGAVFNLANNQFFGNLTSLVPKFRFIDLSDNYFQGPAPNNTRTNVTGNCLQSLSNQRNIQDCKLFYDMRGLPFDNDLAPDPSPPPLAEPASKNKKQVTYVMIGLFVGLGFIVLLVSVLLLLLKKCDRRKTDQRAASIGPVPGGSSPPPKSFSGLGESFSYEQILLATGDFSDTNLIKHGHSGDLFRGELEGGFPVVIKRVDLHSLRKESYMLELECFSKVSHTRLVPLLGHCLDHENEKLLVYKYMPHGDLSKSLYRVTSLEDDSLQSLDWITRVKIAIGAAEGLSYLHHECNPPIVHRDIQASSILLDDKYEVRLGSLSEVHAQEGDNHQNVITRLLRKPQTTEQGGPFDSSSATCAYDVYCFGKVLLELVTGKLGLSKSDDDNTKEWLEKNLQYISIDDKEMVTKILDQSLIVDEDLLEEVWAMAIVAKSCLSPKPSKRPLMRHILRALENPLKVVRQESSSSGKLRTTSSRRSWSAAYFGSWRHSLSENANIVPGQTNREGTSGLKQSGRISSRGSGANSSSHKRSSEIFPEPVDMHDIERQDEN
ncbi:LRR receptor-like serine/threonine-protein kinase [Actinidia chinensis var. chinensis]|uniref:non-specific serine/threonine protein kinase n=1 Tax=Actinidia chinensis var. chinensis TaxID=1590841 RepID=A0A2R6PZU5_ACTCC|nr:LRR receptor-like serine/threonine-protein kinase [Actinidia chinensis var. chinensis]